MFSSTLSAPSSRLCAPAPRASLIVSFVRGVALWRSRRALARLSPEQLRDIGVTTEQAQSEAARPIWDAPENWRR